MQDTFQDPWTDIVSDRRKHRRGTSGSLGMSPAEALPNSPLLDNASSRNTRWYTSASAALSEDQTTVQQRATITDLDPA